MQKNEQIALGWIGLSEGGYVNNKKDPGGATDRGITQRTYDAWNKTKGVPLQSVRGITKTEANQIIIENYFKPVKFNELPDGLDYAMADYAVNSGPARAIKELQRIVGVSADGIIGNQTMQAIKQKTNSPAMLRKVIETLCKKRMEFLKVVKHPTTGARLWDTFGTGWFRRVMGEHAGVQDRDTGVIDRAVNLAQGSTIVEEPKPFETAKAPEPEPADTPLKDSATVGAAVSLSGVLTAATAALGPLGGLHPVAQGIAAAGIIVALLAGLYVMRNRIRAVSVGL